MLKYFFKDYTNLFHSLALQNLTKLGFLVGKNTYHLATLVHKFFYRIVAATRHCVIDSLSRHKK
jgi:hypothetical protein